MKTDFCKTITVNQTTIIILYSTHFLKCDYKLQFLSNTSVRMVSQVTQNAHVGAVKLFNIHDFSAR
jgi:hypothetical protein